MSKKKGKVQEVQGSKFKVDSKGKSTESSKIDFKFWVCLLILAISTYYTFSPSLENEFTNWDDPTYVTENNMIMSNTTQWDEIFSKPVSLNYHPLTMLTLAWNYQSAEKKDGKINARVFHAWNVWLHVFNTLLVFYFIWLLSGKQLLTSFFTAAVFGLHAMHVDSVAWIAERKDVLYAFFFLLSCISYLFFLKSKNWLFIIVSFMFFAASCLSKAMAVVLPVILILIDYLKMEKWNWKTLLNKIPFFILSIVIGITAFRIQSHGAIASTEVFTLFQRFMFGSYGAAMYIVKFFVPFKLSGYYPYPTYDKNGAIPYYFYLAPLIWVLFFGLMFYGFRKLKGLTFGIAFYIVTLLLVLQFLSVGTAIMAERYAYLPYIGLAFAIMSVLERFIKKEVFADTKSLIAASLAILFIFSLPMKTYERTKVYKNSATLWTDVIEKYPMVEIAYKNRGNYYGKELGDIENSYKDYIQLKKMNSKDTKVYSNMGNVYGMKKQIDSSLWAYNKAIALDSNNDEAYINRGITYSMIKEYDKAIADLNKGEKLRGPSASIYQNRAYVYLVSGKFKECVDDYNHFMQLNPNYSAAYYYRGLANEQIGNTAQAKQDIETAKRMGFAIDATVASRLGI